jgi:serine/threonine protein phosphatase PrpC
MLAAVHGTVTMGSVQGLRDAQEDRYVVARMGEHGWLLAIFDGHNGAGAAQAAAERVESAVSSALAQYGVGTGAMSAAVGVLRDEVAERIDGSSATVVYVDEEAARVYAAVLGDSPVIVRNADGDVAIGPLHNTAANPEDADRAVERGAILVGPYLVHPEKMEGVNLTRTIGDAELGFLGRAPEVLEASLGARSFVLVASDGVFTRLAPSPEMLAARFGEVIRESTDAEELVADALAAGSDDNVTVLLWRAADA